MRRAKARGSIEDFAFFIPARLDKPNTVPMPIGKIDKCRVAIS
jgi:hypothetical protein